VNSNPVRAAADLIDAEPSREFLRALRARLLADGTPAEASTTTQQPSALASETAEEYVMLAPNPNRSGPSRRVQVIVLAAAVCVVAVAAIVIINRPGHTSSGGLRDVNPTEASPLAAAAKILPDAVGPLWSQVDDFNGSTYADVSAEVITAVPDCAQLKSVGLLQPTTKSVLFHQDFLNGPAPMLHDVWVFATPADASRAMDVIDGDVYPGCLFSFFDHLTPLSSGVKATSASRSFDIPPIASQGDRQIVIGQMIHYVLSVGGTIDPQAVNVFVQVGRAIAFIDPQYFDDVGPTSNVVEAITASTDALKKVFGPKTGT
jgi:hypothetical protein